VSDLLAELEAQGGPAAPASATARLRSLLSDALARGAVELGRPRSGYGDPVTVALATDGRRLLAAAPARAGMVRADPEAVPERTWLVVAAAVGMLVELAGAAPPAGREDLALEEGEAEGGFLALAFPARVEAADLELAPLCFEENVAHVDRLRARAVAVPAAVLADVVPTLRRPLSATHPLLIAEAVARLGGRPADADSVEALEDAVLAVLGGADAAGHRPHEDPDPRRRAARRILQRLDGMGKWGGYHTEFAHLARGFAGNEKALAQEVGESLLAAGLLSEKPSVGQRHVFLNPRRAADIRRLIERGEAPADLRLT
jgi:hypothetical protein